MSDNYHLLSIDPGGKSGWCRFEVARAAIEGEQKILDSVVDWDYGVLIGEEWDQIRQLYGMAMKLRDSAVFVFNSGVVPGYTVQNLPGTYEVLSEDFILRKLIMGRDLLSPVRINAALGYKLRENSIELKLQGADLKEGVSDEDLKSWGLYVSQKDARAAVKHALVWMRRKVDARKVRPS